MDTGYEEGGGVNGWMLIPAAPMLRQVLGPAWAKLCHAPAQPSAPARPPAQPTCTNSPLKPAATLSICSSAAGSVGKQRGGPGHPPRKSPHQQLWLVRAREGACHSRPSCRRVGTTAARVAPRAPTCDVRPGRCGRHPPARVVRVGFNAQPQHAGEALGHASQLRRQRCGLRAWGCCGTAWVPCSCGALGRAHERWGASTPGATGGQHCALRQECARPRASPLHKSKASATRGHPLKWRM